ncbi:MAG TPA: energy transducer TonB [Candidatus Acidoferrum sp.]|nr:energy transducer TonB [Candidatus Acidoferrum sp.]
MRIPAVLLALFVTLTIVSAALGQDSPNLLPKVIQHAQPIYPPLARQTRIQGDVRIKLMTDGESVTNVEAVAGHPLLLKAAEGNVRTWKFAPHSASSFVVTFRYKLASGDVDVEFLEAPFVVQIEASPPEVIIDYAWLGLGTWKAQLKSAHGKLSEVFNLAYSGPNGDWLSCNVVGQKDESEEIDFGHKEGDFLAFTLTLTQPDGKRVKTFFIGKMMGDKIVGTSVDHAGVKGEWTAIRVADRPSS